MLGLVQQLLWLTHIDALADLTARPLLASILKLFHIDNTPPDGSRVQADLCLNDCYRTSGRIVVNGSLLRRP